MSENERLTTTRGGALKRLLLLAGGAAGGLAGGRALVGRGEPAAAPVPRPATATAPAEHVLYGRDWRLGSHAAEHGKAPVPHERTPKGRLVDAGGRELGTFRAANMLGAGGALQLQTFDLADGTIVGVGSAGVHDKAFAIVGGTGRYAGVSGTYVARQSPRELGGDGTAEFRLNLMTGGGVDGI
jgi:hypothetical protein